VISSFVLQAPSKRTIRFMLWSGEEQGLLGSRAWVESHLDVMPRISAVLVHDMGTNYLSGISCPPALAADLREVFAPVASLSPDMPFVVTENRGFSRAGGSSDHASFLAEGVPGLFWEQDGRTTVSLTVRYASREARDGALRTGMADGLDLSYDRLAQVLAEELAHPAAKGGAPA